VHDFTVPFNSSVGVPVASNMWDAPDQGAEMTAEHVAAILADIRAEFSKGGHLLEVEPEDASPGA